MTRLSLTVQQVMGVPISSYGTSRTRLEHHHRGAGLKPGVACARMNARDWRWPLLILALGLAL